MTLDEKKEIDRSIYGRLLNAENELEIIYEAINKVAGMINDLPEVDNLTLNDKLKVECARKAIKYFRKSR